VIVLPMPPFTSCLEKLSKKSYARAKRLTIGRLIAA
jgi:hypothetical protein